MRPPVAHDKRHHKLRPSFKQAAVLTTDTTLLSADPNRKGVIFSSNDTSNTIAVCPGRPGTGFQGVMLTTATPVFILEPYAWGDLPGMEWHVISTPAGSLVSVIEMLD